MREVQQRVVADLRVTARGGDAVAIKRDGIAHLFASASNSRHSEPYAETKKRPAANCRALCDTNEKLESDYTACFTVCQDFVFADLSTASQTYWVSSASRKVGEQGFPSPTAVMKSATWWTNDSA